MKKDAGIAGPFDLIHQGHTYHLCLGDDGFTCLSRHHLGKGTLYLVSSQEKSIQDCLPCAVFINAYIKMETIAFV